MAFLPLHHEGDLQSAIDQSKQTPVVLYKHSSTCSLSARAHREMELLAEETDLPLFKLIVQESRPLSNRIESKLGIQHETPQIIIMRNGRARYNASHRGVTAEAVQSKLNEAA